MSCQEPNPLDTLDIPSMYQQVVLVTSDSWTDSTGSLQLFSRRETGWKPSGHTINVVVGRHGLAWGRGLHMKREQPAEKVEGDGKAPAGIFHLTSAFGYAGHPPERVKFPYRQATPKDYWIDDVNAPAYNRWVTVPDSMANTPGEFWDSFERMRREDHLYELGVVVNHNTDPVVKGKGSAIFMHVWRGDGSPTAGCTAMSKAGILNILEWLNADLQPLLIQVPEGEFDQLRFRSKK